MHLSIDTREVDNGWLLDAEMPWVMKKKGVSRKRGFLEVYGDPGQVRERVIDLLEKVVGEEKEGIPEKRS